MIKYLLSLIAISFMSSCSNTKQNNSFKPVAAVMAPPVADVIPHVRNLHGDLVTDNYYWMYDYFGKGPDSTRVVNYLQAENEYLENVMAGTKDLQAKLYEEMKGRIKEKDASVPVYKNGYFYYSRTEDGKQYYKYCRKKGSLEAPEELLLDVDKMAEGKAYFNVQGMSVTEDNNLLAYGVDDVSRRQYTIHVKDLRTGEIMQDKILNTEGVAVWTKDNKTFFYTSKNPVTLLSETIKQHVLGTAFAADALVYEEKDKSNFIGVSKSKNNKFIFIYSTATLSTEIRFIDAAKPLDDFAVFQPRMKEVKYDVTALDDRFLIRTNLDAINFRLMECPFNNTKVQNWKEVIPHRPDVLLEGTEEFKNFLIVNERKNGLKNFRIRDLNNGAEHYLLFPEPAYDASLSGNPEYNTSMLRFNYTSLATPFSVYDYNLLTREKQLKKQVEIVGGYDASAYITERMYATANDGTKIPISIVYKKGFKKDRTSPLLLYGYGSYGASMDAYFASTRLSLLNRGFAFAIAHIRGGQEMGRQWYEDGKMMKKKNTFTDFVNAAEFLVAQKFTSPSHLYASGGSAGGLLMGAVVNMAPHLWNGVIAAVPFVDVINTMLDESIPLTTNEFDEWGNPKNKDAYFYMKSYSPYENIERKNYPHMLVTTGLHDSQVQYFEPAKWVAKLRAMKTDKNLLLLKTDMDYGHGGASGRFDYLKNVALEYAFLFMLEGIKS